MLGSGRVRANTWKRRAGFDPDRPGGCPGLPMTDGVDEADELPLVCRELGVARRNRPAEESSMVPNPRYCLPACLRSVSASFTGFICGEQEAKASFCLPFLASSKQPCLIYTPCLSLPCKSDLRGNWVTNVSNYMRTFRNILGNAIAVLARRGQPCILWRACRTARTKRQRASFVRLDPCWHARVSGNMNRKHRQFIECFDIHLKTIVLAQYRGTISQVNFVSFFLLNARELQLMTLVVDKGAENEAFLAEQHKVLQMEDRASRGARIHFTTKSCGHDIHVSHVRDLAITDPFECSSQNCSLGVGMIIP